MEIIEHGLFHNLGTVRCKMCGCKFQYDKPDVLTKADQVTQYVMCPECFSEIVLEGKDDQTRNLQDPGEGLSPVERSV